MNNGPRISDTEWEIMRIVWLRHPITAAAIIKELAKEDPSWHPKTARVLLNRLVKKKALSYEEKGRIYFYAPLVAEEESVANESDSFLQRVFHGSLIPMLAHFVERRQLKKDDLHELRALLAAADSPEPPKSRKRK
jgi:BlaI family penicillinase repressor